MNMKAEITWPQTGSNEHESGLNPQSNPQSDSVKPAQPVRLGEISPVSQVAGRTVGFGGIVTDSADFGVHPKKRQTGEIAAWLMVPAVLLTAVAAVSAVAGGNMVLWGRAAMIVVAVVVVTGVAVVLRGAGVVLRRKRSIRPRQRGTIVVEDVEETVTLGLR